MAENNRLLDYKEIRNVIPQWNSLFIFLRDHKQIVDNVLQDQDSKTAKIVAQEIFKEIESKFVLFYEREWQGDMEFVSIDKYKINKSDYEALKSKCGVE